MCQYRYKQFFNFFSLLPYFDLLCVCLCLYLFIFIYTNYLYIYLCTYVSIYKFISLSLSLSVSLSCQYQSLLLNGKVSNKRSAPSNCNYLSKLNKLTKLVGKYIVNSKRTVVSELVEISLVSPDKCLVLFSINKWMDNKIKFRRLLTDNEEVNWIRDVQKPGVRID